VSEVRVEDVTKSYRPTGGLFGVGPRPSERSRELSGRNAPGEPLPEDTPNPAASGSGLVQALDGINLTIRDGETMAIIGPSGCGRRPSA
jgi:ABC-type sugar transport system ATPase subunit